MKRTAHNGDIVGSSPTKPTAPSLHPIQGSRSPRHPADLNDDFLRVIIDLISVHDRVILVLIETRISGDRADEVSRRIGFSSSTRMEAQGFSGGIWVFWRTERF